MKGGVCVIGGGPAGMMAAYAAAMDGVKVTLFEKNEKLGKKLYLTGKGRCNVTNAADRDAFISSIARNPKFMFSAFSLFSNTDAMAFIEQYGVKLKVERGGRVFPESDKSSDIIKAFSNALEDAGVKVRLNTAVTGVVAGTDGVCIKTDAGEFSYDCCIVATGGVSYPQTGSTGDGYLFAKRLGIGVEAPRPSLIPLVAGGEYERELAGVSLKNVTFSLFSAGKLLYSELGEMLFTHFGFSGPTVLSASAFIRPEDRALAAEIDLKPGLNYETLDARLLRDFSQAQNKAVKNALSGITVSALIPIVLKKCGISPEKKINAVTAEERARLVHGLKHLRYSCVGTRPVAEAIVTRGGIAVAELNARTMECKNAPGVFFCGETLDVDALTGGYNIQIALSTGYAAGRGAAKNAEVSGVRSIAIDGPAGAGKSTIARAVAQKLGMHYLDTGAMYRAVAWTVLELKKDPTVHGDVLYCLEKADVTVEFIDGVQHTYALSRDVSSLIRTQEIAKGASDAGVFPEVRQNLTEKQREVAKKYDIVMDGRDIGTAVLPNADFKFYVTADSAERARRRGRELIAAGKSVDFTALEREIIERDRTDSTRKIAPLRQAEDAVLVDTTDMTIDESVDYVINIVTGGRRD